MSNPLLGSPRRYTKKPVTIEAMQLNSDVDDSRAIDWIEASTGLKGGACMAEDGGIHLKTLEGTMTAGRGDYIIKGIQGEFYPCKPDIFAGSYNPETIQTALQGQLAAALDGAADDGRGVLVIPAQLENPDRVRSPHIIWQGEAVNLIPKAAADLKAGDLPPAMPELPRG